MYVTFTSKHELGRRCYAVGTYPRFVGVRRAGWDDRSTLGYRAKEALHRSNEVGGLDHHEESESEAVRVAAKKGRRKE